MRDDASWFAHWEEELPSPDELMPLSQTLITPDLAAAFDISSSATTTATTATNSPPSPPPLPVSAPSPQPTDDFDSSGGADEPARTLKRPRLVWTPQLHKRFVDAVAHLGIKNAVPKTIMQLMNVDGLTRENVASHLQKYRLYLKRMQGLSGGDAGAGGPPAGPPSSCDHLFSSTPIPPHHHFDNHHLVSFMSIHPPAPGAAHHHHHHFMGGPLPPPPPPPSGGFPAGFDHRYLARHQTVHRMVPQGAGAAMMMGKARDYGAMVDELGSDSTTTTTTGTAGRKVLTLFPTADD
ncbi:unnamed protein product [Victoria cruziana]